MKAADLREKSPEDLAELQKSLAHDVFQNRLKNFTNRLDDTSAIRKTKRDLARVITLLHERALRTIAPRKASEPAEEGKSAASPKREVEAETKAEAKAEAEAKAPAPETKAKREKAAKPKKAASKQSAAGAGVEAAAAPKKKSPKKTVKSEAK